MVYEGRVTTGHTTSTLYGYDSFGRRTTEQLTGNDWQLRTSYDGFTLNAVKEQVIYRNSHTYDAMGPARTTLYAGNTPVAEKRGLTTSYFGTDLSGSVRSVTGLLGTQTDMKNYDVFGTPLSVTNGVNAWYEKTVSTSYGYLGKPYDATTRLYNYGYRDYSSRIGRFTSVDPIRDGNNWYTYVQNDPVNYVDLWGLCKGDKIVFDTNILDVKYQYNLPKNMNGVWSAATPQWPTKSTRITSEFGDSHPLGIDIGATIPGEKGEAIKAAMSGAITTAGVPTWSKSESTYVVIKEDDGYEYRYVHLDIGPVLTGQRVEQRRIIGFMSDNGAEGQVHPHFEIRDENIPTNPFDYY